MRCLVAFLVATLIAEGNLAVPKEDDFDDMEAGEETVTKEEVNEVDANITTETTTRNVKQVTEVLERVFAVELTEANFDEKVFQSGKIFTFVNFLMPFLPVCVKLNPDWEQLAKHFHADKNSLIQIADVDCSGEDLLCDKYIDSRVHGYPALRYFNKDTLEHGAVFDKDQDYNTLKKFVKKHAKPPCDAKTSSNCNKKEKAYITELNAWHLAKIKAEQTKHVTTLATAAAKHKEMHNLALQQNEVVKNANTPNLEAKAMADKAAKDNFYKVVLLQQMLDEIDRNTVEL